ncbi:hypothetical protein ACLOJK_032237 [Asimina triloba]
MIGEARLCGGCDTFRGKRSNCNRMPNVEYVPAGLSKGKRVGGDQSLPSRDLDALAQHQEQVKRGDFLLKKMAIADGDVNVEGVGKRILECHSSLSLSLNVFVLSHSKAVHRSKADLLSVRPDHQPSSIRIKLGELLLKDGSLVWRILECHSSLSLSLNVFVLSHSKAVHRSKADLLSVRPDHQPSSIRIKLGELLLKDGRRKKEERKKGGKQKGGQEVTHLLQSNLSVNSPPSSYACSC